MELRPILSAMRRNKVGAILIAVQVAVTLAILCNALFIIQQRLALSQRPTGTDENNIIAIEYLWTGKPPDLSSRLQTDLATLRSLPGVMDAYQTESYPLANDGLAEGFDLHPDQQHSTAMSTMYFADEHAIRSLGIELVAGRNFNSDEVTDLPSDEFARPKVVIVTRALAERFFPGGGALGKSIYGEEDRNFARIIGIVDKLQAPWTSASGFGSAFADNAILEPFRFLAPDSFYIVRTQPGQLTAVMQSVQKKLFDVDRTRIIKQVQPMTAARADAYRDDRGLAVILGVVCAALVSVTVFGIVGLTSYWVSQRQRQIGIRRALGATRIAIVRYFQTENLLIASAGALLGIALAITLNLWMVSSFEMERLHIIYAVVGAVIMLLLGQLAVLWPALRAASIPPALATRSS